MEKIKQQKEKEAILAQRQKEREAQVCMHSCVRACACMCVFVHVVYVNVMDLRFTCTDHFSLTLTFVFSAKQSSSGGNRRSWMLLRRFVTRMKRVSQPLTSHVSLD